MLEPKCFYKFTKFCQILILTLWFVTLPCFLAKIVQILQKIVVVFPERWDEIEPWFWHISIAQRPRLFPATTYLFWISVIFRGNGWSKLDQKCKLWFRLFFMKTRILQFFFKQCFYFLFGNIGPYFWDYILYGGVRAQKPPKKGRRTQNFEHF